MRPKTRKDTRLNTANHGQGCHGGKGIKALVDVLLNVGHTLKILASKGAASDHALIMRSIPNLPIASGFIFSEWEECILDLVYSEDSERARSPERSQNL